jgi:uncharacterized protein
MKVLIWISGGFALVLLFLLLQVFSLEHPLVVSSYNLWAIFLTGLVTGGLTCLAVQGGLLAATIAQREEERLKDNVTQGASIPILAFLGAKLAAYTLLGILLGLLGSVIQVSVTVTVIMQFAVSVFMIVTALNILNIHPIFRYFVIQPPKFLMRLVRNQSKSKSIFAPALLGAFTVLIPCGTTQAMIALAVVSGSPWLGAAVMFAFILGTLPVFFILGLLTTKLGDHLHQKFMRFAAFAILILAAFNINNTLALTGFDFFGFISPQVAVQAGLTEATIEFKTDGYYPKVVTLKSNSDIKLHLKNTSGVGCIQSFVIPKLGITKVLPVGSTETLQFKSPTTPGQIAFVCGMGMYRGVINVVN